MLERLEDSAFRMKANNIKVKFTPEQALEPQAGSRIVAVLFL
jgi:hypothetical protein